MITSFWATFRLRIWLEHVGTKGSYRVSMPRWLELIFAPNGGAYHYEHHRWPSIPYWNLPKARLFDTSTSVIKLKDHIEFLKNHSPLGSGELPIG